MALPWIKLYTSLPDHPKSDLLSVALGVDRAWTHVVELWLWVARMRPNGHIGNLPPELVAKRAGWSGDAAQFLNALQSSGFLDEHGQLHGWSDAQSAHAEKLQRDADRARVRRGSVARRSRDELRTSHGRRTDGAVSSRDGRAVEERRGEREEKRGEERRSENSDQEQERARAKADEIVSAPRPQEPMGAFGEIAPKTADGVLATEHRGERLLARWRRDLPGLSVEDIEREVGKALAHRMTLDSHKLRAWSWPEAAIAKIDSWLRRAEQERLRTERERSYAAKSGVHAPIPEKPKPKAPPWVVWDRRRDAIAAEETARLGRERGDDVPPFDAHLGSEWWRWCVHPGGPGYQLSLTARSIADKLTTERHGPRPEDGYGLQSKQA